MIYLSLVIEQMKKNTGKKCIKIFFLITAVLFVSCLSSVKNQEDAIQEINSELQHILNNPEDISIENLRGFYFPQIGIFVRGYYNGILDTMEYFKPGVDFNAAKGSIVVLLDTGNLLCRLINITGLGENESFLFFITNGKDELFRRWGMEEAQSVTDKIKFAKEAKDISIPLPNDLLTKPGMINGHFYESEIIEFYEEMNDAKNKLIEPFQIIGFSNVDGFVLAGICICIMCDIDEIDEEKQNELDSIVLTLDKTKIPFVLVYQKRKKVSILYKYDLGKQIIGHIVYNNS